MHHRNRYLFKKGAGLIAMTSILTFRKRLQKCNSEFTKKSRVGATLQRG